MIGSHDQNLSVVRDYISKNCTGSGENISSAQDANKRKIVFSPNIFEVPSVGVNQSLVSVMMPFHPAFTPVYDNIKNAANNSGLTCLRADDIWNHSTVIQDIFSLIFESFIVVCDFTGKNPNVFYEAGIAHTLGKHVIPITQSEQDIPFDLQHHRYIKYLNNGEGLEKLRISLQSRLSTLTSSPNSLSFL